MRPTGVQSHDWSKFESWRSQVRIEEIWTPLERIRTLAELDVEFAVFTHESFVYQDISSRALELFQLGMNYTEIAKALNVTDKTVTKAIEYAQREEDDDSGDAS